MRTRFRIGVLAVLLLLLAGCSERVHTPQTLAEWGRAAQVGTAAYAAPVGLVAAPDGSRVALSWVARAAEDDGDRIHLLVLAADGEVLLDEDLDPAAATVRQTELLLDSDGRLLLLWLTGGSAARALWAAPLPPLADLGPTSIPSLAAERLSPADVSVQWFKAVPVKGSPDPLLAWLDERGRLSVQRGAADPLWVQEEVVGADFQLLDGGQILLAWFVPESVNRLGLFQAIVSLDGQVVVAPQQVSTVILGNRPPDEVVNGPVLSLDDDQAYLSWTQKVATMIATLEYPYMLALPAGGEPRLLGLSADYPPQTGPVTGGLPDQELAPLSGLLTRGTAVSRAPTTSAGRAPEAVLAYSTLLATRNRQEYQPVLIYLRDGEPLGYQALTWTNHPSIYPVMASDAQQNLYVAWNDASGELNSYLVYLASTAPDLHRAWRNLTLGDYLAVAGDLLNRVVSGVFMVPLVVIWLLLPFPWLFLAMLWYRGDLYGNRSRRVTLVALFIYWASKYLLTGQILVYLPGIAGMEPAVVAVLTNLVPVLTLLFASLIGWLLYIRRAGEDYSLIRGYLTIAVLDWLMSLAIYSIGWFE